ncbi:MAG: ORF6N domain-containing protein [Verrucomicrobia bacterium]|nr:ORF6N domain-containing protein [Verrucomicrobiota bacterium]
MKVKTTSHSVVPASLPTESIARCIYLVRGEKVMLDSDLAELYGVETKAFNQAVQRNLERFPGDFMFQLSAEESQMVMRSQIVTSNAESSGEALKTKGSLRSQIVTSNVGRGGRRYQPYVFTEQGVAMLSSVLSSPRSVQVNIAIMRTFVQLRQMLATHADLAQKLAALEGKYDKQFRMVFDAIRELMNEKKTPKREIGFHAAMPRPAKVHSAKAKKI